MEHKNVLNSMEDEIRKKSVEVDGAGFLGVPVHIQVMKIKREIEKIHRPSLQQEEMRLVLLRGFPRERSRSPLGLSERPISVGNA